MQELKFFHNINHSNHQLPSFPIPQKKIIHQLDNEGCKCTLCQKVVLNEMKIVKYTKFKDLQSEHTMGKKQQYLTQFLYEFFCIDKMNRKIKFLLPQICIFQKGNPTCLMAKKKDILPLKLMRNKEKMNAFQIQNFFMDGYIYHNNLKENEEIMKNHKVTTLKKEYYKFDEYLRNECIVVVKFMNGACQIMTPVELSNLFKSKQKHIRQEIAYIQTMACAQSYNEVRVHIDLTGRDYQVQINDLYERAKNEVKMINENIKPKDFMFIPEREERKFQQELKKKDQKEFLKYLSLKFLLIYSLKTDVLLQKCLFKFMKSNKADNYYIIDLQVYHKVSAIKLWGEFEKNIADSPSKATVKRRPASSPEKLQTKKVPTQNQNEQHFNAEFKNHIIGLKANDPITSIFKKSLQQSRQQINPVENTTKGASLFKLEPIRRNSQRTKRFVSSIITKNQDTANLFKRFL